MGFYYLSTWASGNLVIANPKSEKNWMEELVVISGKWYSDDTLPKEIPSTSFEITEGWKKPTLENYDKVLIQERIFLANLPIQHRHWKVLLSWKALAKCKYMAGVSTNTPRIDEVDPFIPRNLDEATRDLGMENKCSMLI